MLGAFIRILSGAAMCRGIFLSCAGLLIFSLILLVGDYMGYMSDFRRTQLEEVQFAHSAYNNFTKRILRSLNLSAERLEKNQVDKHIPSILNQVLSFEGNGDPVPYSVLYIVSPDRVYTRAGLSRSPILFSEKLVSFQKKISSTLGSSLDIYFEPQELLGILGKYKTVDLEILKGKLFIKRHQMDSFLKFLSDNAWRYVHVILMFFIITIVLLVAGVLNDKDARTFYQDRIIILEKKSAKLKEDFSSVFEQLSDLQTESAAKISALTTENTMLQALEKRKTEMGAHLLRSLDVLVDYCPNGTENFYDIHSSCADIASVLSAGLIQHKQSGHINLFSLVADAQDLFGQQLQKGNLKIVCEEDYYFSGDELLIRLVFLNVLGRAIFSSTKNSEINVNYADGSISILGKSHSMIDKFENIILKHSSVFLESKTLEKMCEIAKCSIENHTAKDGTFSTRILVDVEQTRKADNVVSLFA